MEELWLLLALAVLLGLIYKYGKEPVLRSLDGRAGRIRSELEEAQRLREEAQSALATYQRRHRDAMKEAEEIIAHARDEAERQRERTLADLGEALKRREAMAMERIAQAEAAALAEVRNIAIDVAVAATRAVLADKLDAAQAATLVDQAIDELPAKLH